MFAKEECVAVDPHAGRLAYRCSLQQNTNTVTIVSDLISGNSQGAGEAIAQASASNGLRGIASAITSAKVLVRKLLVLKVVFSADEFIFLTS